MPPKIPDRERTQLRLNETLFRKAKAIARKPHHEQPVRILHPHGD